MASPPLPPGKLGLPWIGETLGFVRDSFGFFETRFRRHGHVFKTRVLGSDIVCLIGPEAIDMVNREQRLSRVNSAPRFLERLFGAETLPFLSGEVHSLRRSFALQAFTPPAITGYTEVARSVIGDALVRWRRAGEVRAVDELDRVSFTLAEKLFFGTVAAPWLRDTVERFNKGFGSLPINLPFLRYGKALKARAALRAHAAACIDAADPDGDTILAHLVRARRDADDASRHAFAAELLHAFIVAHGSLRAALVSVTRALGTNADVMDRTSAAVRDRDRVYLDQVTREVRRYHKIIPLTGLSTALEELEYGGYRIPAGWKVTAIIHSTMWDEAQFARPAELDPARFAGGCPRGYVAHGAGPSHGHRCPGEPLADAVLATYLEVVLESSTWEVPAQDLRDKSGGFAPMPRDGLRTRYVAR